MYSYSRTVRIDAPIDRVFHFHDDTSNLLRITPPNTSVSVLASGNPGVGNEITLRVTQFGIFTSTWKVRITEYVAPFRFTDEQVRGPFRTWIQRREFKEVEGGTELTDSVDYALPFGIFGALAHTLFVRRQISSMFAYRQQCTKELLEA
ncbi:MAG: SRPBCC family protein [Bacteroidetes bacterium]|nr:SRPBCC family protein [Bacteroidota bacterium]